MQTESLEGGFTLTEIRLLLAKYLGRDVKRSTLYYWRKQIGMSPNEIGLYDQDDLEILIRLGGWISRGGTIHQFANTLFKEQNDS